MKNIYIIRHGQTDYNLNGIVQGRGIDSELNNTGKQQAEAFFQAYSHIDFDIVYASSLKRTQQTIGPFLMNDRKLEILKELDEIDWGIYEGIAHDPKMHSRYEEIIDQWRNNELDIRIDGGESASELYARLSPFVTTLSRSPYQNILVCSHGRSIRALLCAITGTPLSRMDDFPHANTSLYKLLHNDKGFQIDLFNNTDHLDPSSNA